MNSFVAIKPPRLKHLQKKIAFHVVNGYIITLILLNEEPR